MVIFKSLELSLNLSVYKPRTGSGGPLCVNGEICLEQTCRNTICATKRESNGDMFR
jgi:hypothetical protein